MARSTDPTGMTSARPSRVTVAKQILAVVALSSLLGLVFNASNPIGVRWAEPAKTLASGQPALPVQTLSSAPNPPDLPAALFPPNLSPAEARQIAASTFRPDSPPRPVPSGPAATVTVKPAHITPSTATTLPPTPLLPGNAAPNVTDPSPFPVPPPLPAAVTPHAQPIITAPPTAQPRPPVQFKSPPPVTWADTKSRFLSGEIILIDARPKSAFEASHIPGAISLPENSSPDDITAFQKRYGADSELVIYCSSPSCPVSRRVAQRLLNELGYEKVSYMPGGFQEWQRSENSPERPSS